MAIRIPHKFQDRLAPGRGMESIKILIVGSFNPGVPILSEAEYKSLDNEYQRSINKNQTGLNFYDRANNRFWGVLDRIYFNEDYLGKSEKYKRAEGLKLYKGLNTPERVFELQQQFCNDNKIFITDIVSEITVPKVQGIYNGFGDQLFDSFVSKWNTQNIEAIVETYRPRQILFTFSKSKSIPRISKNVQLILDKCPTNTFFLSSPSGNAKKSYSQLLNDWGRHFQPIS